MMFLMQLAMWCLELKVEGASMLARVTPLMGAFSLQLLSSFFFSTQHAYLVIIFFSHMISILLDMHAFALLG